jgi:PKD repeat protein
MVSTQATGDARVNIRSNTTLNVGGDLYMRALRQAKVGHHANITVGETFTIISNGETLSDEDSDWSSIAYDSVINAKRLSVTSYEKVSIGARTIVNTDSIYLNALDCKIGATSQINSITKEGNCFSGLHPDARFRTTPIGGGEAPLQLFINGDRSTTPTGNIVAYHWEFVGLGTVTTTIPTTYYTFNEPGTYRIRLQVENSEGLKNTTSRKIIVTGDANQAPTSSFIISDSDILVGESISVDASSSTDDYQIRKYHWNLSNGASLTTRDPIANFTFNEIGNVDISLIVEDFFGVESAVSTQTITVNSDTNGVPASAYFNVDLFPTFTGLDIYNRSIAGDGEIVELYYLVDGIRYDLYDFTYGSRINLQNISHDGDIEVSIFVTDSLGNQSSLTKTFVMDNTVKPIASFELEQSNSLTAYVKAIKSYDPLNDINSISIDWGDGAVESINPTSLYLTHQYLQAGDYNVTLTINTTRGESSSHTKTISIIDGVVPTINPTALFEVQKDPALGHVRVYVSESGTPNGSITGYSWQMGDGNVIEGLDQVAYFYDVGIYPVTLTITDSLGLTSSQTQTIVITENGDPLVISPQCSTNSNTLTADCVTYVAHRFAQFNNLQVDWGDGSVENFSPLNPYASLYDSLTHTYSEAGSYTATFYATAANGDTATVTREFYFDSGNMRPTGYISCNSNGLTVFCNGTGSYDPDGFITHYEFEVAQGNVIFSQDGQLSFTYPQAGTYEISLVAYDQLGLASIPVSTTITLEQVNNPPVAQLNCNSDSAFKVSCDAIGSYDSDGGIYTYEYIFYGDTTESVIRNTDSSFNYYFESAGNKRIDLIVTDDKGVSATTTINVDVLDNIAPIAAFSCSSDAVGELSCDGSSSSDSDGTISQYNWTINGQTYSGQVISVSGISATNVTVQLQVVDNAGATNMSTGSVSMYVNQAPVANFVCSSNNPQEISCDASSSSDDDIIQSYTWTINSQNYTGQNIVVSGILSSSVEVSLEVVDSYGETNQKTTSVNVSENQPPVVAFDCMSNSLRQISCTSSSTDSDGTIMEYKWTIDGINYFGQNINESLATGGNKAVTLHVTDNLGGTSSLTKNIEVIEAASPNIVLFINGSVSSYQIIEGQINFASSVNSTAGDGSIASREWFIDDVLVGTGVDLDISTYLAGAYRLKVVITNSYGISSFKEIDLIVATDVTPEFSITDITNYAPKEIQLTFTNAQQFVGIDTIEWRYFKEDKSFFGTSANFALNFLGNQEILLVVKDTNGATYTTELTVNVQNDGTYL